MTGALWLITLLIQDISWCFFSFHWSPICKCNQITGSHPCKKNNNLLRGPEMRRCPGQGRVCSLHSAAAVHGSERTNCVHQWARERKEVNVWPWLGLPQQTHIRVDTKIHVSLYENMHSLHPHHPTITHTHSWLKLPAITHTAPQHKTPSIEHNRLLSKYFSLLNHCINNPVFHHTFDMPKWPNKDSKSFQWSG